MSTVHSITKAEQLEQTSGLGRCELVRGELVMMSPAGFEHGRIISRLTVRLGQFVELRGLGITTGAETGFIIERNPDSVRAPDLAFLQTNHVPTETVRGFFLGAPDLAVEVLSPDDRPSDVIAKVQQWLAAGCQSVWVVDPRTETITHYVVDGPVDVFRNEDVLRDKLLPEFQLPVAEVFAR